MRQQYLIETLETNPRTKYLALRSLTAIHKKSKFFMLDK
jgi:hypothetical protein